jgi:hypothetical protein
MHSERRHRNLSTIAPQSLALLNSELSLSASRELPGYLFQQAGAGWQYRIELC